MLGANINMSGWLCTANNAVPYFVDFQISFIKAGSNDIRDKFLDRCPLCCEALSRHRVAASQGHLLNEIGLCLRSLGVPHVLPLPQGSVDGGEVFGFSRRLPNTP